MEEQDTIFDQTILPPPTGRRRTFITLQIGNRKYQTSAVWDGDGWRIERKGERSNQGLTPLLTDWTEVIRNMSHWAATSIQETLHD